MQVQRALAFFVNMLFLASTATIFLKIVFEKTRDIKRKKEKKRALGEK